jgi:NADP-dependent aldehyde dehydrogenase
MNSILVGGRWRPANKVGEFTAYNPDTSEQLDESYPISSWEDCSEALDVASRTAEQLELVSAQQISSFLERYADRLGDAAQEICRRAELETALPLRPRLLDVEMPRTIDQLRQAAEAARKESWRCPINDSDAGIHACYGSIGPALIFGPNNFPLAFNAVSGGDFAAAIAAGNPVIAKAHSSHPGTSRMLAEQAHAATADVDLPAGTVQLLYGVSREDGLRMVADPRLKAAAFTGSRTGGLALKSAADAVGTPIYLEMSSVNPVFFLPGAVAEGCKKLPAELVGSCLLSVGQFCTCPNLFVLLSDELANSFLQAVKSLMEERPVGALLARSALDILARSVGTLRSVGAEVLCGGQIANGPGYRFQNTLLRVNGEQFLSTPDALQTEAFGPVTLAVMVKDENEFVAVARHIEGSLTASVYSAADGTDDALVEQLMRVLRRKVGRLINDKMPTGVAVSPAMNHGGPFPATGHPGFTAVGIPASLRRFTKLDCYDNVRLNRLPSCLRESNND